MDRFRFNRVANKARFRARALIGDRRGIAAVEFGLIAPVLLIMLIGVIEITRAVSIDRRFGQVTSMVADLIAREDSVTEADVNAIYGIVEHVMGVWGTDTLKLEVIPVRAAEDDTSDVYVYAEPTHRPSYGTGAPAPRPVCQRYSGLTENLLAPGGMAIVVEGEYSFSPLLVGGVLSAQTWRDKAVLAPRTGCTSFENQGPTPVPGDDPCVPDPDCE
jgi:Flp pilus assembly pilin Flp